MTLPSPMRRIDFFASASSSTPVASIGSFGRPIVRAKTFVEPPGSARERSLGAGETVGHLVQRAVATEHGDDVDPVRGGALREAGWRAIRTRNE